MSPSSPRSFYPSMFNILKQWRQKIAQKGMLLEVYTHHIPMPVRRMLPFYFQIKDPVFSIIMSNLYQLNMNGVCLFEFGWFFAEESTKSFAVDGLIDITLDGLFSYFFFYHR
ncbi:hypothetical protein [Brevibacillus gelatini]|uniref:Uncharacterized protein n=1 Tax=Brevibacillus gelatini TaxID=1655277 RepID=A0A3M8B5K7_9BACL|nr:hypothetical protein [Brevibacillus gelatini]RNB58724.1 hypothetical protein EDM57_08375 [Brevibacillus gelatini]